MHHAEDIATFKKYYKCMFFFIGEVILSMAPDHPLANCGVEGQWPDHPPANCGAEGQWPDYPPAIGRGQCEALVVVIVVMVSLSWWLCHHHHIALALAKCISLSLSSPHHDC